jgi:hypothetical protein
LVAGPVTKTYAAPGVVLDPVTLFGAPAIAVEPSNATLSPSSSPYAPSAATNFVLCVHELPLNTNT